MLFVACSGFPIPVSRYWREFQAVEISDTEVLLPGAGTIRRWIRESPEGYAFTVVAPKSAGAEGFKQTTEVMAMCTELAELGTSLGSLAVVFAAEDTVKPTKPQRSAIKAFVDALPTAMPAIVLDLPGFKTSQIADLGTKRPVVPAYDPFADEAPTGKGAFAYLRLPGPAGHRSRYDDAAIDQLAEHCVDAAKRYETVMCVFRNIDMQSNAHQLMKKLGK